MLYITKKRSPNLIINVRKEFGNVTYHDIQPYINAMLHYKAFIRILGTPEPTQTISSIGCETDLGYCLLSNIATSIQIVILCKMAIAQNKPICFIAGQIGDNFLPELISVCQNTNLVSLYCPEGLLPQLTCPERMGLEEKLRNRLKKKGD